MPSKYEIHAQDVPAVLYSASFAVLVFYFLAQIKTDIWGNLLTLGVGGVSMTFALYQLAKHAGRFLGVELQERLFQDGRNFPTTQFLLDSDQILSAERKNEIIAKIKTNFGVDLAGSTSDTAEHRQRIHEVVGRIRKRFFEQKMVLQRNIQYGFWRNLAGGSVIAVCVSVLSIVISALAKNGTALMLSLIFLATYTVVGFIAIFAMKACAKYYALALYDELLDS